MAIKPKSRQPNRAPALIAIFLAVVMVASVLGIMLSGYGPETQQLKFNGHTFVQEKDYLTTTVGGQKIKIQNYPETLATVEMDNKTIETIKATRMVFISSPLKGLYVEQINIASYDLKEFLEQQGIYTAIGLSDENTGYEHIPVITCANATIAIPVILFTASNETSAISIKDNCIIVEGYSDYDFVRLKDRLVLGLAGVI